MLLLRSYHEVVSFGNPLHRDHFVYFIVERIPQVSNSAFFLSMDSEALEHCEQCSAHDETGLCSLCL